MPAISAPVGTSVWIDEPGEIVSVSKGRLSWLAIISAIGVMLAAPPSFGMSGSSGLDGYLFCVEISKQAKSGSSPEGRTIIDRAMGLAQKRASQIEGMIMNAEADLALAEGIKPANVYEATYLYELEKKLGELRAELSATINEIDCWYELLQWEPEADEPIDGIGPGEERKLKGEARNLRNKFGALDRQAGNVERRLGPAERKVDQAKKNAGKSKAGKQPGTGEDETESRD